MTMTPERTAQSFSGAHPYRPQCVVDAIVTEWLEDGLDLTEQAREKAAEVTAMVDDHVCPRCETPLDPPHINAGSRATRCRCVPICPRCGEDEGHQGMLGTGLSQVWRWPVRKGDVTKRWNKVQKMITPVEGVIMPTDDGTQFIHDEGVTELRGRPHPGGWAEFGYDDSQDEEERKS